MLKWQTFHPYAEEMLGFIPHFLNSHDPRPAREQFNEAYTHGGGWHPLSGWQLLDKASGHIKYPGDPALKPVAKTELREETIFVYPHAWVAIIAPDGSYEIARMD